MRSRSLSCATVLWLCFSWASSTVLPSDRICFPDHFSFGVATASYQIEGAWKEAGKGENIWDRYTHEHPERVFDHSNGDVGDDAYHHTKDDVKLLKELGVGYYRFSISWARILPTGFSNEINPDGIRYYQELIDELEKNGIQPLVTMYHWDLPQSLQDLGGWTNPIMADYFLDYAIVLFENFGDKVKVWTTFNEPFSFCHDGYGGNDAPGARSSGLQAYMCGHNVLRAHAKVYRTYVAEYKMTQAGWIGITMDLAWFEANSTSTEDQAAAETARQFHFGWFANAIFSKQGDYPPIMRKRIDELSRQQNFSRSRLPNFTREEVASLRGSSDFLGLNHYTTYLTSFSHEAVNHKPSYENDMAVTMTQDPTWPKSNSTWLKVVPWGFRKTVKWLKKTYDNPLILVTENGISSRPGLQDHQRIEYIHAYLRALYKSITIDDCRVIGYTYWSLMDNFEWTRGFSERFGLFQVNYTSPHRERTARLSAKYFSEVARTGCLPPITEYNMV